MRQHFFYTFDITDLYTMIPQQEIKLWAVCEMFRTE